MPRIPRQRVDGPDSYGGGIYGRRRQPHKRLSRRARLWSTLMYGNPIWLMLVAVGLGILAVLALTIIVYFI